MDFKINREKLAEKLRLASKVLPRGKATSSAANSIYFQIRNNQLAIWAANGVVGMVTKVGPIEGKIEKADIVFPADKLVSVVLNSKTTDVKFTQSKEEDTQWTLRTSGNYKIRTWPEEYFPKFDVKGSSLFKVSVDSLNKYLSKVSSTVSEDEGKPTTTGVLISKDFVSTDTKRISIYKTKQQVSKSLIVPMNVWSVLSSFSKQEVEVLVMGEQNGLIFKLADTIIQTRVLEGEFPNYQNVLDRLLSLPDKKTVMVPKKQMVEVLSRLKVFADVNNAVSLDFTKEGKLILEIGGADVGTEEVSGVKTSVSFEMKLFMHISTLEDFLNVFDGEMVVFHLFGDKTPVLFEEKYSNGEELLGIATTLVRR